MLTPEYGMLPEERASFEKFQDEAIAQFTGYANYYPQLHNDPERLQHELWNMGKFIGGAVMGLARLNPSRISVSDYPQQLETPEDSSFAFSRLPESTPPLLTGEAAYTRMLDTWNNPETDYPNDFTLKPMFENSAELTVRLERGGRYRQCKFKLDDRPKSLTWIYLLDTSNLKEINDRDGCFVHALVARSQKIMRLIAPLNTLYEPSFPRVPLHHPKRLEESTRIIAALSGQRAAEVFTKYGEVGLYQHLLWTTSRLFLGGLNRGPTSQF